MCQSLGSGTVSPCPHGPKGSVSFTDVQSEVQSIGLRLKVSDTLFFFFFILLIDILHFP